MGWAALGVLLVDVGAELLGAVALEDPLTLDGVDVGRDDEREFGLPGVEGGSDGEIGGAESIELLMVPVTEKDVSEEEELRER